MLGIGRFRAGAVVAAVALAFGALAGPSRGDEALTWGTLARPGDVVPIAGSPDVPSPAGCEGATTDLCERFAIQVLDPGVPFSLAINVSARHPSTQNIDLYVYDPDGNRAAHSAGPDGWESLVIESGRAGTWEVRVNAVTFVYDVSFSGEVAMIDRTQGSVAGPIDFVNGTCVEPVPVPFSRAGVTDDGRPVALDVLVVLDGVGADAAAGELQPAATAYAGLGVELRFAGFVAAGLPPAESGVRDADATIEAVRDRLGGRRPAGSDVVYILTAHDLASADSTLPAGKAHCIGGVRWPEMAFAIGERFADREPFTRLTAKIAAHEIGHLMGAHHHYSNCAETAPSLVTEPRYWSSCTTMAPDLGLIDLQFSTLSGATVRGHAVSYAE